MKPDFAVQGTPSDADRLTWFTKAVQDAITQGCVTIRGAEQQIDGETVVLVEGWKVKPIELPEPAFFVPAEASKEP